MLFGHPVFITDFLSHLREIGCVIICFLPIKWLIKDFYPSVTVTIEIYYGGTLICNAK